MTVYDPLEELRANLDELREAEAEAKRAVSFILHQVDNAQGCDDTGNVVVTIDSDDHIKDSELKPNWRYEIDAPKLGDSHGEAVLAAREQKEIILANLIAEAEKNGTPPEAAKQLDVHYDHVRGEPTRTYQQLANDYLAYTSAEEGPSELGTNELETVSVEANRRGFAWCGIDENWAADQDPWLVSAGVVEASSRAKQKIEQRTTQRTSPTVQDIVEDALRLFRQTGTG